MNKHGKIVAISSSLVKGIAKTNTPSAELRVEHGIVGDAHAGPWHRQISFLASESIQAIKDLGLPGIKYGDFAENITTEGIELSKLPVGSKMQLGTEALVEITQIGKECHNRCHIYQTVGDCAMPREGVFARVLQGGFINTNDIITILSND